MRFSRHIFFAFLFIFSSQALARDINLDEIYLKRSRPLKKLVFQKLDTYDKVNAILVDSGVIYSGWISGEYIVYIKETPVTTISNFYTVHRYHVRKKRSDLIAQFRGVVSFARISYNGKYLFIKRIREGRDQIPLGETLILNTRSKKILKKRTSSPFMDFSIPFYGNSIIYASRRGFVEFFPDLAIERLILNKRKYADINSRQNTSIAFLSPDRKKTLVINGGGGNYRARLIQKNRSNTIAGITSATELFWIDNYRLVFRRGSVGYFSTILYDVRQGTSVTLLKNSMNTNISFSQHSRILSLLKDQIIMLYPISDKNIINTGIEGEDISFDPTGNRFTTLLFKKLFIVHLNTLKKKRIELRRSWSSLLEIYRGLKYRTSLYDNEYSGQYIKRKIRIYEDLLK